MTNDPYDLIVIGGGSAGLTAVNFAAQLGARVALVEKHRLGGDCTWTGCVPSKALRQMASTFHFACQAAPFGFSISGQVDMTAVKHHIQQTIHTIYQEETPAKIAAHGVDVFLGAAQFLDPHRLQVGEKIINGKKFLLASGARPLLPPLKGLAQVSYLTYEQIFENTKRPSHLLIVGAGPTGLEIGQAYCRLGVPVTLVDQALLPGEEPEVAAILGSILAQEGVGWVQGLATAVEAKNSKFFLTVTEESERTNRQLVGDMLMIAAGRVPNTGGLGLEVAGVAYSEAGIPVDGKLRTTAAHIYAAGDCTGGPQFTHYAGWQAFTAVRNALLPGNEKGISHILPRVTFTDPEVAQVGLTEAEAKSRYGEKAAVLIRPLIADDRPRIDGATQGFLKIIHQQGTVLGATIVAPRAGEMITELAVAIRHKLSLADLGRTIHAYPTYSSGTQLLAAEYAADAFLNSTIGRWIRR